VRAPDHRSREGEFAIYRHRLPAADDASVAVFLNGSDVADCRRSLTDGDFFGDDSLWRRQRFAPDHWRFAVADPGRLCAFDVILAFVLRS